MMPSTVYWGSPHQTQLDHRETLPAKLDLILEQLKVSERVKDHRVAIKVHLGVGIGYSVLHPVLVRRVVQAVLAGGGKPFVTDLPWCVEGAATRGYTAETLGCPIYPSTGLDDKTFVSRPFEFRNVTEFHIGTPIVEATFLIDLAHVKGHPQTGWGAAIKNLALGCMDGATRSAMHDVVHWDPSFFKDKCPDEATRIAIRDSCPFGAIVDDKEDPNGLHLHDYKCNGCMRCTKIAPGAFGPQRSNQLAFMEVCNIAAKLVLDTFEPENQVFINVANNVTPVCDCYGITGLPMLPDVGVFGSNDIVAVDQAALDMLGQHQVIEANLPRMMEIVTREGHPFQQVHGLYKDPQWQLDHAEAMGMGTKAYTLVDVFPLTVPDFKQDTYVSAQTN